MQLYFIVISGLEFLTAFLHCWLSVVLAVVVLVLVRASARGLAICYCFAIACVILPSYASTCELLCIFLL